MHLLPTLFALLLSQGLASAEFIAPSPVSECAAVTATSKVTCSMNIGCCAAGECCAGGCCPIGAFCINKGRGDEGCCPLDDATTCGVVLPTLVSVAGCYRGTFTDAMTNKRLQCPHDGLCDLHGG